MKVVKSLLFLVGLFLLANCGKECPVGWNYSDPTCPGYMSSYGQPQGPYGYPNGTYVPQQQYPYPYGYQQQYPYPNGYYPQQQQPYYPNGYSPRY